MRAPFSRIAVVVALVLALGTPVTESAANNTTGLSLRAACENKCAEEKAAHSADCKEALGMVTDASFAATCETESAREAEYCSFGFEAANATNVTDAMRGAVTDSGKAVVDAASGNLRLAPSVSAALSIGGGLAVCFFGYRLMRPTMFVCGFLVGGFVCSSVAADVFDGKSYEETAKWVALFIGGLLVGWLLVAIYSIGIFIIGAAGGVLLAVALNTSVGFSKLFPEDPDTALILLAKGFRTQDPATGDWVYDTPRIWWMYLACMLGLFLLGMLVQFKNTSVAANGGQYRGHRNKHDYA
ncbi:hypothetical protein PybrP1_004007 [[Pythium] brassicae (nom. inval.)]|nr:hypothetical protein PybrP1_004007 [[Pythium] brassicae (nom. inval.)]